MPIQNSAATALPSTTLNITVTPTLFEAPDNMITHGTNYANWTVDAGSSKDSTGITLVQNSGSEYAEVSVSDLAASTTYWCAIKLLSKSAGASGNIRVTAAGTSGSGFGEPTALALYDVPTLTANYFKHFKLKTDASGGPWKLRLEHNGSANGEWLKLSDIRVYSIPSRSAAKVAVLGDRAGGYNSTYATAVDNALMSATADTVNVLAVGDQADTTYSHSALNLTLQTAVRALGGDIFPMMGNHDYDGSRESEWFTFYSQLSALNGGKRYYKKTLGNMDIFTLDDNAAADNPSGTAPEDNAGGRSASSAAAFAASVQGAWLQAQLAASTAKWKVVMIHHPPYTSSSTGPFVNCRLPFATWGANLVLQSHDHSVERLLVDGIYYYTCAMGGGNHHGWGAALPETKFRLDSNHTASFATTFGYLKISDSAADLILEYFDTTHQLFDRARISQP